MINDKYLLSKKHYNNEYTKNTTILITKRTGIFKTVPSVALKAFGQG